MAPAKKLSWSSQLCFSVANSAVTLTIRPDFFFSAVLDSRRLFFCLEFLVTPILNVAGHDPADARHLFNMLTLLKKNKTREALCWDQCGKQDIFVR